MDEFPKITAVPVPRATQTRRAIEALGARLTIDKSAQGRRAYQMPPEELAGVLHGISEAMLFGIDPGQQPGMLRSVLQGYGQGLGGAVVPCGSQRDALYMAALGLKAGLARQLFKAAALAAYTGGNRVGRAGITLIASRLARAAQDVAMNAVGAPGADYGGIAGELHRLADMIACLSATHDGGAAGRDA
ncbi:MULTISPECIES: hypothetical protein [unclassified Streptomyces]|uniref:hypothetical protein n=1 Tax=unclassified Streptomyces TaxID=2593676 RepID=UPI000378E0D0|nr:MULTISPECIES: hypothetical protein [unclassified Streptomyces]MYT33909.1 hypothetical protein [Streptomyces sp. SID8354]